MPDPALQIVLGAVLVVSAGLKLVQPNVSRAALGQTFGVSDLRAATIVWFTVSAAELALGVAIAVGSHGAAYAAAALMVLFAAVLVGAILRGQAGEPCGCFGARSRVGWPGVLRNLVLAAAFAALPAASDLDLATDTWLGIGLGVALVACVALGVAVFALAREIGSLRMSVGPSSALEIPEEGPEVGSRVAVISRFDDRPDAAIALAVFSSPGCLVCEGLRPAVASLANHPLLAVRTFEEDAEAATWSAMDVPGAPYAVAMDRAGTVLSKGTFNNLAQLESVIATAERRRDGQELIAGGTRG